MDFLVLIAKIYLVFFVFIIVLYIIRHYLFTFNRALSEQRLAYQDILDSDLPFVTVLIPMHNEERVAKNILNALLRQEYPKDKLQIIPINDHSTDKTSYIIDDFARRYNFIQPLHRVSEEERGKSQGLNDAIKLAKGEIIVVYDADYLPPKGQLYSLVINFIDPEVGAVMGRVVPINTNKNLLTRLLDLERSGGYQVDQQARFNLKLIPQYGGTVGAFRKCLIEKFGGFSPKVLAEDTELTFRIYLQGYKVLYVNKAECYEEAPQEWTIRAKQIRRWARGHNQVMFKYIIPFLTSKRLNFYQKLDGILLLFIYFIPLLMVLGIIDSLFLFFFGHMEMFTTTWICISIFAYSGFGNFAPFFEIGTAAFLDSVSERLRLLPLFYFIFLFNMWYSTLGVLDSFLDLITLRRVSWEKTIRYRG